jgi:HSP20 family molecular chaperone IbpA
MAATQTGTTTATGQQQQSGQESRSASQQGEQGAQGQQAAQGQQRTPARQEQGPQDNRMTRRDLSLPMSPFSMLQRFFTGDIFNLLDSNTSSGAASSNAVSWVPNVDVVQRGSELIARIDLPGVDLEDVVVEVGDDAIRISGERMDERTDTDGPVYRVERTYGAFYREIPLPPGAMTDQATATFNDGVLEIKMPAPPEQVSRGRRVEVSRGDEAKSNDRSAKNSEKNKEGTRSQAGR